MNTDTDDDPVVIYTLPDDMRRLHLRRVDDYMLLIKTESPHMLEQMNDRIIKLTILEDIIVHLDNTPRDIEIRFPTDPEHHVSEDVIVEYEARPIQIGVLSYIYKLSERLLIVQASFIK